MQAEAEGLRPGKQPAAEAVQARAESGQAGVEAVRVEVVRLKLNRQRLLVVGYGVAFVRCSYK